MLIILYPHTQPNLNHRSLQSDPQSASSLHHMSSQWLIQLGCSPMCIEWCSTMYPWGMQAPIVLHSNDVCQGCWGTYSELLQWMQCLGACQWQHTSELQWGSHMGHCVMKVTFTSIFHPFFLTFSIPLPLRGGKLPTKRPYCGIPRHYGLLGPPGQHSLYGLLSITKTMMSTMTTGLLTHAAIQYTSLYSAAFCGRPY